MSSPPEAAIWSQPPAQARPDGGPYAWWVLFVLIVAFTVSFIDRQILTLMVGPIRASFGISDTQLSLLHGLAFAIFYTTLGIPIGRIVDRRRRTTIIALGIVVWSVMTALCGAARSFVQLFLARIGVGVGEAALSPGAYSILSDYFPSAKLATALNIYTGAAYIGSGIATIAGGALIGLMPSVDLPVLGHMQPWQMVFMAVGTPGFLAALLVLSLREPARQGMAVGGHPGLREVLAYLAARLRAYGLVIAGYSMMGIMWNGALAWLPTFLIRQYGWTPAEIGLRYGLALMGGGLLGAIVGGLLSARLRRQGPADANIRIGLIALAIATPAGIAATRAGSGELALGFFSLFLFGCSMPWGGAAAALQEITPNQMRGQMSAIYLFCLSLTGAGFGPTLVALLTDHLFGRDDAVGQSLALVMMLAAPLSALLLSLARAPYRAALARNAF